MEITINGIKTGPSSKNDIKSVPVEVCQKDGT